MGEKEKDVTMSTPFGALKQVEAGLLSVGYGEAGPPDGQAVLLLHGWPYDIHSFGEVTPVLAAAGYRVIVPFVRGYGPTCFLSGDTLRNGQQAALAVDVIALMDALGIEKAILAGFDWGGRSADVVAALWPDRCRALVSVSGYLIGSQAANQAPLSLPPLPCPLSPSRATPTARRTRTPAPTPTCSRANMRTGWSRAGSGTTCPTKPRRPSPRRSSTSTHFNR